MKHPNITLCLTIGKRPELLRQTLNSILKQATFEHIIAINDFNDEPTNQVFYELCPQGILINLGKQIGHHSAIDTMYRQIKTDYVFHCEDDWLFDRQLEIKKYVDLLNDDLNVSVVCLRKWSDFSFEDLTKIRFINTKPLSTVRLDHMHDQWHGYTFNPHIASIELWKLTQGFAQFKKERHISRWLRAQHKYVLFLKDGICHHIGNEQSVANHPKMKWHTKLKKIFCVVS